jgi:cell division protein FtsQ
MRSRRDATPDVPSRPAFSDWADERVLASQSAASRRAAPEPETHTPSRRRWVLAAGGAALLGIGAALVTSYGAGPRLRELARGALALHAISVEGAGRISSSELVETTGLVYGTSLLDVDPAAAEARLLAHPWVSGARVMRLPPGRVLVSVALREPVAWVRRDDAAPPLLVDATGAAFAPAAEADLAALPRLVPAVVAMPDGEPAPLKEGAEAARAFAGQALGVPSEIHLGAPGDPDGVWLRMPRVSARVVLGAGDFDAKLAQLRRLLAAGLAPSEAAEAIDLRFADRAVLRSQPGPEEPAKSAAAPGGAPPPRGRAG